MGGDYSFNNVDNISLTIDDDLGGVSININMEINNWYNSPPIEFSTYYTIDMTGDTIPGIMMNMIMQMNIYTMRMLSLMPLTRSRPGS